MAQPMFSSVSRMRANTRAAKWVATPVPIARGAVWGSIKHPCSASILFTFGWGTHRTRRKAQRYQRSPRATVPISCLLATDLRARGPRGVGGRTCLLATDLRARGPRGVGGAFLRQTFAREDRAVLVGHTEVNFAAQIALALIPPAPRPCGCRL